PDTIETFAGEVAPAVRERVAEERRRRGGGPGGDGGGGGGGPQPPNPRGDDAPRAGATEYARLGVTPTPDDGGRVSARAPWDESTRPHRRPSGPEVTYTRRGRLVGRHLIDVHDVLRRELSELRDVLQQVREGATSAGDARAALNE